jgi:hypothetical protein
VEKYRSSSIEGAICTFLSDISLISLKQGQTGNWPDNATLEKNARIQEDYWQSRTANQIEGIIDCGLRKWDHSVGYGL